MLKIQNVVLLCALNSIVSSNLPSFKEIIYNNGYSLIEYNIVTGDGYILALHRVVTTDFATNSSYNLKKPVLLQHGLFGSSNNFFINSHTNSNYSGEDCGNNFGFCLLETGLWDVWVGNSRGNGYSEGRIKNHTSYLPYWAFSFEQMARYDLPATIDYIRDLSGHHYVAYVGYSQGTASMFALLLSDYGQRFHDIIQPFVVWAPPIYLKNFASFAKLLDPIKDFMEVPIRVLPADIMSTLASEFCGDTSWPENRICPYFFNHLLGRSATSQWNKVGEYLHYILNYASSWSILHFSQLYENAVFQHFDYGTVGNLLYYNQAEPPSYDTKRFPKQVHVQIFNGVTDAFISMQHARRLWQEIDPDGSHSEFRKLSADNTWSHFDYIISSQAGKLVYKPTIDYLNKF